MEVADERNFDAAIAQPPVDFRYRRRRFFRVDRNTNQFRACLNQGFGLFHCSLDVGRIGVGHRLDDDRMASTDEDATHIDGPCPAPV